MWDKKSRRAKKTVEGNRLSTLEGGYLSIVNGNNAVGMHSSSICPMVLIEGGRVGKKAPQGNKKTVKGERLSTVEGGNGSNWHTPTVHMPNGLIAGGWVG